MKEYDTNDIEYKRFRPHGRVRFSVLEDGINIYRVIGPFNQELHQAFNELEPQFLHELQRNNGKYCDIVIFEESCLALDEVVKGMAFDLITKKEKGQFPLAAAFVMSKDVEGISLMTSKYEKCYKDAKLAFSIFENESDAIDWVKTYLSNN